MTHAPSTEGDTKRTNGPVDWQWAESYSILIACISKQARAAYVMPMCEVAAEYEPPAPPHMPESEVRWAAAWGYMTAVAGFRSCWSLRSIKN
jgi:hypothetical protein